MIRAITTLLLVFTSHAIGAPPGVKSQNVSGYTTKSGKYVAPYSRDPRGSASSTNSGIAPIYQHFPPIEPRTEARIEPRLNPPAPSSVPPKIVTPTPTPELTPNGVVKGTPAVPIAMAANFRDIQDYEAARFSGHSATAKELAESGAVTLVTTELRIHVEAKRNGFAYLRPSEGPHKGLFRVAMARTVQDIPPEPVSVAPVEPTFAPTASVPAVPDPPSSPVAVATPPSVKATPPRVAAPVALATTAPATPAPPPSSGGGLAGYACILVFAAGVYFLPSLMAVVRSHHQLIAVAAVNLLTGWTGIGWVVALLWAGAGRPVSRHPQRR